MRNHKHMKPAIRQPGLQQGTNLSRGSRCMHTNFFILKKIALKCTVHWFACVKRHPIYSLLHSCKPRCMIKKHTPNIYACLCISHELFFFPSIHNLEHIQEQYTGVTSILDNGQQVDSNAINILWIDGECHTPLVSSREAPPASRRIIVTKPKASIIVC